MGPFVLLAFAANDPGAADAADALGRELDRDPRWAVNRISPTLRLHHRADRPVRVRQLGSNALALGDLFDSASRSCPERIELDPTGSAERRANAALTAFWGRYVLTFRDPAGRIEGVLRSPLGTADMAVWSRLGVTVVATDLPSPLLERLGPARGFDWSAIHGFLADPLFGSPASPLDGIASATPGAFLSPKGETWRSQQLWRPATFAGDPLEEVRDAETALRHQVDACVAALAGVSDQTILAEVSGGLDSAIVAGALVAADAPVSGWCNHVTPDPSGDERLFARALGRQLGLDVREQFRPSFAFDPALLEKSQSGPRPSAFALDTRYDAYTIETARRFGAKRLFTGFGGDGLFCMAPMPEIARDLYLRRGVAGLCSPEFGALARWCRTSVWALAGVALRSSHPALDFPAPSWVIDGPSRAAAHPWLKGLDQLPPAKIRHIEEQVLAQIAGGRSLRGDALDVVHPLLSQPVLELCLRIPVDLHVAGGRDRALARRAFRDRLPLEIAERRSKGEMGAYYSQAISAGLPDLRDYLLGGRLRQHDLLDAPALERVLDESHLAQHGDLSTVLYTAAIEAWVRRWEGPATDHQQCR